MKEKPVAAPIEESTEPPQKRKSSLLFIILLLLFLAFCIFAVIMRIRDPNITLWKLLRLQNLSILPKKSVIQTRPPKLLTDKKVTEKITENTGGTATVVSPNGYTYRVSVGPGVVTGDGSLTLTPLEEPPFTWPSDPNNNNPPPDPGIDIVIDPPPPPPPPPDEPPVDPDNPPEPSDDPPRPPPVVVVIIPPGRTGTVVNVEEDPTQIATDLMAGFGLGNLNLNISVTPTPKPETKPAGSAKDVPTAYVYTPRAGNARIIPIRPRWANGNPDNDNPRDGDEGDGDVPGEGTVTPEDPEKDKGKSDDAANQAGANGHCTDEYIFTYTQAYNNAKASGDQSGMDRYGGALKDCAKDKLSYLKRLCEVDPTLVRRKDFKDFAASLGNATDKDTVNLMAELMNLENSCQASYSIKQSGEPAETAGSYVIIVSGVDSTIKCGYVDDAWEGKTTYNFRTTDGVGVHNYEGNHTFKLPSRGGVFDAQDYKSDHGLAIIGIPIPLNLKFGLLGTFDGVKTVDILVYPGSRLHQAITLTQRNCAGNLNLPPIEPIKPNNKDKNSNNAPTPELAPLTTGNEVAPTPAFIPLGR